jgi:hypothetical protein
MTPAPRSAASRRPHSHSIVNSFGKSLIGFMQEPQRLHAYRQNYRHFQWDPLAQPSPSIDIYIESRRRFHNIQLSRTIEI